MQRDWYVRCEPYSANFEPTAKRNDDLFLIVKNELRYRTKTNIYQLNLNTQDKLQTKEINIDLRETNDKNSFPPDFVQLVFWYIAMRLAPKDFLLFCLKYFGCERIC